MTGFFITFEGIDGCGKSTQAVKLADHLRENGRSVVHTRQPGGTPLGTSLRELLLHRSDLDMSVQTEVLLMCADRADHVQKVVRPALARAQVVVCERYTDSTLAYQGFANQVSHHELNLIESINRFATDGLMPDVTFLLDLDPDVAAMRRNTRPDRIESKTTDYHCRVREGYLEVARRNPNRVIVIDASQTAQAVHATILECLAEKNALQ